MQNDIDRVLVKNILNGDVDSFSVLVSAYQDKLYNFLLGLTSCKSDAEEILQEVFIRVYNYLYRYNDKWCFSTWIYHIAANAFKDQYSKKKQQKIEYCSDLPEICDNPRNTIESMYEIKESYMEVVRQINVLKSDQRIALILRLVQGFTYDEIAKVLGVSADNARMKVCRAKQSIASGLKKMNRGVLK